MARTKLTDEQWNAEDNADILARYQKDGRDLSPTIHQGQRISDLRGLADLSVDELAERSGIERKELLALEAGLQSLQPAQAARLAESMEVDYSDLWVDPNL